MNTPHNDVEFAVMVNDIKHIKGSIDKIEKKLEGEYVSRAEFDPIKKVVYGLVALTLTSVVGAVLAIVIKS